MTYHVHICVRVWLTWPGQVEKGRESPCARPELELGCSSSFPWTRLGNWLAKNYFDSLHMLPVATRIALKGLIAGIYWSGLQPKL